MLSLEAGGMEEARRGGMPLEVRHGAVHLHPAQLGDEGVDVGAGRRLKMRGARLRLGQGLGLGLGQGQGLRLGSERTWP